MKKIILYSLVFACTLYTSITGVHAEGFETDSYVYLNNIDQPSTIDEIQAQLTVSDEEDGDLTDFIYIVHDNYSDNQNKLGDFVVIFGVKDSQGVETTLAITVRNVDINAPEFILEAESTLDIPQYSRLATNLPRIKAIDSYEGDLTTEISIEGLEAINTNEIGSHTLIYSVSDSSGNTQTQEFTVNVVDSTNPEIQAPNTIIKRSDTILEANFFLDYISATDDIDGIITNRIEVVSNAYLGNANKSGTYQVIVSVSDLQGNYIDHTFNIKVVDTMIPRLIIDNYYWVIGNDYQITDEDYIKTLRSIEDLPNLKYVFNTTYDNYTSVYTQLDTFQKDFILQSSSGEEFTRTIVLEVVEASSNLVEQDPSFIQSNSRIIFGGVIGVCFIALFIVGLKKK